MKKPTPSDVAVFMKNELDKRQYLYQEEVVCEIESNFGSQFVYINENGNQAIDREVLSEFRKITPNVIWERGDRCWRLRQEYDEPASRIQE